MYAMIGRHGGCRLHGGCFDLFAFAVTLSDNIGSSMLPDARGYEPCGVVVVPWRSELEEDDYTTMLRVSLAAIMTCTHSCSHEDW